MAELLTKDFSLVVLAAGVGKSITPLWLMKHELVSAEAVDDVRSVVINSDFSNFKMSGIDFFGDRDRIQLATSTAENLPEMFDIFDGIFRIWESAVVTAFGANTRAEYKVENEHIWHKIGHTLAPKQTWNEILPNKPGLLTMRMRALRSDGDTESGHIEVEVGPSMSAGKNQIRIQVNEHMPIDSKSDSVVELLDLAQTLRDVFLEKTRAIEEKIIAIGRS